MLNVLIKILYEDMLEILIEYKNSIVIKDVIILNFILY